jgi:hypothetical protein
MVVPASLSMMRPKLRRGRRVIVPLAAALTLAIPVTARAQGVLDQSQTTFGTGSYLTCPDVSLAQTFTAGASGGMDRVDVGIWNHEPNTMDLTIQIQTVSFGLPSGTVLAEETVPVSMFALAPVPTMIPVPLDPPASVQAGTQYAIVSLAVGLPCLAGYAWQFADETTYGPGEALTWLGFSGWGRVPSDLTFATYVDPSLPAGYAFEGFFAPVQNPPALNQWIAATPLPIRFSLGGDQGLAVLDGRPQVTPINCSTLQPIGRPWNAAMSPLTLGQDGRYSFLWKTQRTVAGRCRQLTVNLDDGTSYWLFARFKPRG